MANRYLAIGTVGRQEEVEALVTRTGTGDAGKIVATASDGRIDPSVLPLGVGPDLVSAVASEAIGAGKYVNLYNNGGVTTMRLADNSNDRPAHGFCKDAVANAGTGLVYFEGPNAGVSGRTIGARQYLGTAGSPVETVPAAPAILQYLGIATQTTEINTDIEQEIKRN
jgi:hypothetical protein